MIPLLLLFFFLLTRLINITSLPIFNDEANYVYWAKLIASSNHQWFIILTAGKPPLVHWLMVLFLKILPPTDFLLAGRLPSVLAGAIGSVGIFFLAKEIFKSKQIAFLSTFLYIICPFILFYDRLALFDSMLMALIVCSTYFMFKSSRTQKVTDVIWWGTFMGLAYLSKPNAIVYWGLLPIVFVFLSLGSKSSIKKIIGFALFATLLAQVFHFSLVVSTGFKDYLFRSLDYTNGPNSSIVQENRFLLLFSNLGLSFSWLWTYYSWPIILSAVSGFGVMCLKKKWRLAISLAFLWTVPIVTLSFFGGFYFPRYILFTTPFFLIVAAFGINQSIKRLPQIPAFIFLLLILTPALIFDLSILKDVSTSLLPKIERESFITGYPSSYGFQPIYEGIDEELKTSSKITLLVQGTFSHFPNAFRLRYFENSKVEIYDWQKIEDLVSWHGDARKNSKVLLVFRSPPPNEEKDGYLNKFKYKIIQTGSKPSEGTAKIYLAELL